MERRSGGNFVKDERFWAPHFDKEKGIGYAVIRFLPPPDGESVPFVKRLDSAFQGPTGSWYMENSPRTLGRPCPLAELRGRLYNSGIKADEAVAGLYKIRKNFYANIIVVSDPANKSNEGKVFLYRFGPKIYEFIEGCIKPQFPGEKPSYPYDPDQGRNFVIRMSLQGQFISYEKSSFDAVSEIYPGDDAKKDQVLSQCHSLQELTSDKHFKSYEELAKKLRKVLGETVGSGVKVLSDDAGGQAAPAAPAPVKAAPVATAPAPAAKPNAFEQKVRDEVKTAVVENDDSDVDALFKSLADD